MRSVQKIALSLLISVVAFTLFALFAFSGFFSFVEGNFYDARVRQQITQHLDSAEAALGRYRKQYFDQFKSIVVQDSIKRINNVNQSAQDIFTRKNHFDKLLAEYPGILFVRFVDSNGNIHFSTRSGDVLQASQYQTVYKTLGRADPNSAYAKEIESTGVSDAVYIDSRNGRLLFRLPWVDYVGDTVGSAVFYVSLADVESFLVRQGVLDPGQTLSSVGNVGFTFGVPVGKDNKLSQEVLAVWQSNVVVGAQGVPVAATSGGERVFLFTRKVPGFGQIADLVPQSEFSLNKTLQLILSVSLFLTVFLLVFLLLSLKQDKLLVLADRIKRFQISFLKEYLESKSTLDWARWHSELELRRSEVRREIKKGIGRVSTEREATVDGLIDKSWDEILSVIGKRVDEEPAPAREVKGLEDAIRRLLASGELSSAVSRGITAPRRVPAASVEVDDESDAAAAGEVEGEVEELSEVEELEEVEPVDEGEPIAEAEPVADEEADSLESVEEVEELSEVEEFEEVEPVDEGEPIAEVEPVAEEAVEELKEAEALESVEEVEELSEVEELEELEEVEGVGEAELGDENIVQMGSGVSDALEDVDALDLEAIFHGDELMANIDIFEDAEEEAEEVESIPEELGEDIEGADTVLPQLAPQVVYSEDSGFADDEELEMLEEVEPLEVTHPEIARELEAEEEELEAIEILEPADAVEIGVAAEASLQQVSYGFSFFKEFHATRELPARDLSGRESLGELVEVNESEEMMDTNSGRDDTEATSETPDVAVPEDGEEVEAVEALEGLDEAEAVDELEELDEDAPGNLDSFEKRIRELIGYKKLEIYSLSDVKTMGLVPEEAIEIADGVFKIREEVVSKSREQDNEELKNLVDSVVAGSIGGIESPEIGEVLSIPTVELSFEGLKEPSPEQTGSFLGGGRRREGARVMLTQHGFNYDSFRSEFRASTIGVLKSLMRISQKADAIYAAILLPNEDGLVAEYSLGLDEGTSNTFRFAVADPVWTNLFAKKNLIYIRMGKTGIKEFDDKIAPSDLRFMKGTIYLPIVFDGKQGYLFFGLKNVELSIQDYMLRIIAD